MPAGHPGDHAIQTTWTDKECAWAEPAISKQTTNPGSVTVPGTPGLPVTELSPEPTKPKEPTRCVACNHTHKGGQCKCGCHEHIG